MEELLIWLEKGEPSRVYDGKTNYNVVKVTDAKKGNGKTLMTLLLSGPDGKDKVRVRMDSQKMAKLLCVCGEIVNPEGGGERIEKKARLVVPPSIDSDMSKMQKNRSIRGTKTSSPIAPTQKTLEAVM